MAWTADRTELEWGSLSLCKKGEELCGDQVRAIVPETGDSVLVLADGLGSGVQANILSTLASTLLSRMVEGGLPLREAVDALARTLPVSKDRGNVAYSTFTIAKVTPEWSFTIYNFDNPEPLFLHGGKETPLLWDDLEIGGKAVRRARGRLAPEDALLLMSDGAVYAGVGETLNFGWTRKEIGSYMEALFSPGLSAKNLATLLVDHCRVLYNSRPGDDTTALVLRRRKRVNANLLVGPATNPEDDGKMMSLFFSKEGKHLVCGGTTGKVCARYLGTKVEPTLDYPDPMIPPISHIDGVDLATEGVITLNALVRLAEDYLGKNERYFDWSYKEDGASLLARVLFEEASDISFFVGCAVNPAHQDPSLGISIATKMQLVEALAQSLRRMGKHIRVAYF